MNIWCRLGRHKARMYMGQQCKRCGTWWVFGEWKPKRS